MIFFNKNKSNEHITRIKEKIANTTKNFEERIKEIEFFAESLSKKTEQYENKINRFKSFCHNINILITDKDKDLKLVFANHTVCEKLYGLPNMCSELIENRFEYDVINDYIEKTEKWNSFIECVNFNIDEIVKEQMIEKKFLQIGYIDSKKLILKTTIKPHINKKEFDGVMTISNIINENEFNNIEKELIYDKNDYIVYEI